MKKENTLEIQDVLAPVAAVAAFVVTYETLGTLKYSIDHFGGSNTLFGIGLAKIKEMIF